MLYEHYLGWRKYFI